MRSFRGMRWVLAAGVAGWVLAMPGCGRKSPEPGAVAPGPQGVPAPGPGVAAKTPIRLAVACPMSGSAAAFGEMIQRAAKLKAQEVNAAGGIHGSLVELSVEDDRGNTTEATNIARRITADPSICLVIGHFNSTCTNAAKEEYNRKGVPEISPGSTNVNVCVGYPWTFRNLYRDDYQGTFLARYARKVLNMAKVAVFYDNDDYGKGLMQAFVKEAKEQKLGTLDPIAYIRERTQDFKPLVSEVKDKGVDGVFVAGLYNEGALIAKAAVTDLKMAIPVFGGEGLMNGKFIEIAGAAAEGAYVTTPFLFNTGQDTEEAITFMKNFERQYGIQPDTWAALTYDAVGMALDAVRQVGPDRKKIRDWLASITTPEKGYKGVTGNTYFDEEGDCYSKGAHVAIVRDGKFVPAPKQLQPEPDGEQE